MAMSSNVTSTATSAVDTLVGKLMEREAALCVPSTVTVTEASRRMLSHLAGVEAAVVEGITTGMLTDLDVVRSLATKGWMSAFQQVKKVATIHPNMVRVDDKTVAVLGIMLRNKLEHVPVAMESKATGIVSITTCLLDVLRRFGRDIMQVNGTSVEEVTVSSLVSEDTTSSFVEENDTITSAAAAIMKNKRAVMVLREGQGVGVVTPKDVMKRVFVEKMDIETSIVKDVMNSALEILPCGASISSALEEMRAKGCLHVLVGGSKAGGRMAVVVHVWDIVNALVGNNENGSRMEEFIQKIMSSERIDGASGTTEEENAAISPKPRAWESVSEMAGRWEGRLRQEVNEEEKDDGGEAVSEGCHERDDGETPEGVVEEQALILPSDRTVAEAAISMATRRVDAALITRRGCVVGVITHRTLTCGVIAARSPGTTSVLEVMTPLPMTTTAREPSVGVVDNSGPKAHSGSRARRLIIGVGLSALAGIGVAILARRGRR